MVMPTFRSQLGGSMRWKYSIGVSNNCQCEFVSVSKTGAIVCWVGRGTLVPSVSKVVSWKVALPQ